MTVLQQDWMSKWALYSPDKIAFKEYETQESLTYGQLNQLGNRIAHYLVHQLGLTTGDRVAILAENCLAYPILFAAAQKTGITIVPINYRLAGPEIDYLLSNSTPRLAIVEEKFEAVFQQTPYAQKLENYLSLAAFNQYCTTDKKQPEDQYFPVIAVEEDHPIFILYTSGTTGFPKGALYTHKMLFWNSINTAMSLIINSESRTVNCMPPFHTGGWNVLMTPFMHHGGYTCLIRKFDPATLLQLLQEEACTLFMGVPTMLKMMADTPAFTDASFPKLHYIIVGGEPMPIPLIERWDAKQVPIRQGYGMTEVGPNLTSLHQDDAIRKKGSIGRPNFYVNIRIVDEAGNDLPANTAGELLLKGPMVTPGYWKNEDATAKALKNGWFHTGDMVKRDEEDYLYVVDRIKNMFISGGENVYPAEVERVLCQHPAVSEAAVIGVSDEQWGEVGHAFIVCWPGQSVEKTAIQTFCKAHLAKFKVPKHIAFIEKLPKNDTGKINRQSLKKLA
jgi:fatty-acyl-CoA synthase